MQFVSLCNRQQVSRQLETSAEKNCYNRSKSPRKLFYPKGLIMRASSGFYLATASIFFLGTFFSNDSNNLEQRVKELEQKVEELQSENNKTDKTVRSLKENLDRNNGKISGLSREVRNVTQDQKRNARNSDSALRLARSNQSAIRSLQRRR